MYIKNKIKIQVLLFLVISVVLTTFITKEIRDSIKLVDHLTNKLNNVLSSNDGYTCIKNRYKYYYSIYTTDGTNTYFVFKEFEDSAYQGIAIINEEVLVSVNTLQSKELYDLETNSSSEYTNLLYLENENNYKIVSDINNELKVGNNYSIASRSDDFVIRLYYNDLIHTIVDYKNNDFVKISSLAGTLTCAATYDDSVEMTLEFKVV